MRSLENLSAQSTPDLLGAFVDEGRALLRAQVQSAKLEIADDVRRAKVSAGLMSFGAACLGLAGAGVAVTGGLFLATLLPAWIAAAIVTGALLLLGLMGLLVARSQIRKISLKPEQTLREFQEDGRWMKQAIQIVYENRHSGG